MSEERTAINETSDIQFLRGEVLRHQQEKMAAMDVMDLAKDALRDIRQMIQEYPDAPLDPSSLPGAILHRIAQVLAV